MMPLQPQHSQQLIDGLPAEMKIRPGILSTKETPKDGNTQMNFTVVLDLEKKSYCFHVFSERMFICPRSCYKINTNSSLLHAFKLCKRDYFVIFKNKSDKEVENFYHYLKHLSI